MTKVKPEIFRAYDVRGIYPDDLDMESAYTIANATARYLRAKTMVVGEDGRISSPQLSSASMKGITDAGCNAIYIGRCTSPVFYFAVNHLGADGGVMITASHNPAKYNGMKIVREKGEPIGIFKGLDQVRTIALGGAIVQPEVGQIREDKSAMEAYLDKITNIAKAQGLKYSGKIVVDSGNGAAVTEMKPLLERFHMDYIPQFFDIDGRFPNRDPDTTKLEALEPLRKTVLERSASFGCAFDGDADRFAVVDEKGQVVPAQYIAALLWQMDGSKDRIAYDFRFSRSTKELFGPLGIPSRVGHTNVANLMKEKDAVFGAEMSGHFFFKDLNFDESSGLAFLKLVKILEETKKPLSELIAPYRKYYFVSENAYVDSIIAGAEKLKEFKLKYANGKQYELDGLTVEYEEWWFNIRPSNTEPILRITVEATTQALLDDKKKEILELANKK
jgi:phosphomannomutase